MPSSPCSTRWAPTQGSLRTYHYQLWSDPPTHGLQARLIDMLRASGVSTLVTDRLPASTHALRIRGTIQRYERVGDGKSFKAVVTAGNARRAGRRRTVDRAAVPGRGSRGGRYLEYTVAAFGVAVDRTFATFYKRPDRVDGRNPCWMKAAASRSSLRSASTFTGCARPMPKAMRRGRRRWPSIPRLQNLPDWSSAASMAPGATRVWRACCRSCCARSVLPTPPLGRIETAADGSLTALPEAPAYLMIGAAAARACSAHLSIERQNALMLVVIDDEPAMALRDAAAKRALWQQLKPLARRLRAG